MELFVTLSLILGTLLLGAMSPGPSFILVAKLSMDSSRKDGVAASIGMGIGGLFFATLALFGLQTALTVVPTLYVSLKLIGGVYLLYLGVQIWREAKQSITVACEKSIKKSSFKKSFLIGLITQVSNPKTAIVYGSIFAALLPPSTPITLLYILPPLVFLVEACWYIIVSLILSSSVPRLYYLRSKNIFDRLAGGLIASLGVKIVVNANR